MRFNIIEKKYVKNKKKTIILQTLITYSLNIKYFFTNNRMYIFLKPQLFIEAIVHYSSIKEFRFQ